MMPAFSMWGSDGTSWSTNYWSTDYYHPVREAAAVLLKGLKLARAHLALVVAVALDRCPLAPPLEADAPPVMVSVRSREHRLRRGTRRLA